jgi:hypothetical protein
MARQNFSHARAVLVALAALAGAAPAMAYDMNAVTGPVPGSAPIAMQCATSAAERTAAGAAGMRKAFDAAPAAQPSRRVTVDGSAQLSQTWSNCSGTLPRSIGVSVDVAFPLKATQRIVAPTLLK